MEFLSLLQIILANLTPQNIENFIALIDKLITLSKQIVEHKKDS
jgi:hypothetical protein